MEELFGTKELHDLYKATIDDYDKKYNINKRYYEILNVWLRNRNNGIFIADHLINKNIRNIAIYGWGNLGEILYGELKNNTKINIEVVIDRNTFSKEFENIKIIDVDNLDDSFKVDAIIVTPIYASEEINNVLRQKGFLNNYSIEDIIYELEK